MLRVVNRSWKSWLAIVALCGSSTVTWAQLPSQTLPTAARPQPPFNQPSVVPTTGPALPGVQSQAPTQPMIVQPMEHPLAPAINRARFAQEQIAKIQDYSATLVKRERIDGKLKDHEYLFIKVRHQPFSVYIYFLHPADVKGQECLYVAGKNNGQLWARPNGVKGTLVGTLSLKPDGPLAMMGQRYPVTELGLKRLTDRLVEVGTHDMRYGECTVKTLEGAKIENRLCTCYEIVHPVPRKEFQFHMARVFVDSQLNIPVRYEAYDWPAQSGGAPVLYEEYTYQNISFNNNFTDLDFDTANPKYQFKR